MKPKKPCIQPPKSTVWNGIGGEMIRDKIHNEKQMASASIVENIPSDSDSLWAKAPEWAMWAAKNGDGQVYFFEDKPVHGFWFREVKKGCLYRKCLCEHATIPGPWRDSLRPRPLVDKHENKKQIPAKFRLNYG